MSHRPPIMMQPGAGGMPPMAGKGAMQMAVMPPPQAPPPNCPPGLEYLAVVDHLFVRQCIEPLEIFGFETQNAYQIFSQMGMIYWAQEHSNFCVRQCCGADRPFEMSVTNPMGIPVMLFRRPCRCRCWLCCCCLQELIVECPPDRIIGKVQQDCNPCGSDFTCRDMMGSPVMQIRGPSACCRCCTVEFEVISTTGQSVGKVTKQWGGLLREMLTDADVFGISFPAALPVEAKAIILGACILIDFMFFEDEANKRR